MAANAVPYWVPRVCIRVLLPRAGGEGRSHLCLGGRPQSSVRPPSKPPYRCSMVYSAGRVPDEWFYPSSRTAARSVLWRLSYTTSTGEAAPDSTVIRSSPSRLMISTLESLPSILDRYKLGVGTWLIGSFVTTLLLGMTLLLTLGYFRLYPSDPLYMKLWVIVAVTLQAATTAMVIFTSYHYLVTNAFNLAVLAEKDVWSVAIIPVLGSFNNLLSESFFARRVYLIGPRRYKVVVASAMLMIIASSCVFVAIAVNGFTFEPTQDTTKVVFGSWSPAVGFALLLAGDLQLTAVLVYFLYQCRSSVREYVNLSIFAASPEEKPSQPLIYRTNSMLDFLIACTVSTGAVVCALSLATLIVAVATMPHNIAYTGISIILQGVYTASFIIALNTRRLVRSRGELEDTGIGGAGGFVLGEATARPAQADIPRTSLMFAEQPTSLTELSTSEDSATTADAGARGGSRNRDSTEHKERFPANTKAGLLRAY
ncbi:hypothetical protein C8Q77DRAFT_31073 [Trametes polyzona]|nr:hypothetical protein C8Q77DRAFT_31073 [Trametes polyzona]